MQITSDSLFSSAFSSTHLWNRSALLWEICFSWSLSVFSTASTCLNLALHPRLQTCMARSPSQVSQLAVVANKSLSLYNNSWKSPCSWELRSMWKSLSIVWVFPAILACPNCLPSPWMENIIYQTYWEQCPATHIKARKKHSQDYLPKGYHAYYSMTLQYLSWGYPDTYCIK